MSNASISVAVSTRNRADKLERCLEHIGDAATRLEEQRSASAELIVVDNGSTGHTDEVLRRRETRVRIPLYRRYELRPGLSRARNVGVGSVSGDIIAMTDDDCMVDRNWLVNMYDHFAAYPEFGLLGGRVELRDARDRPVSIRAMNTAADYRGMHDLFYLISGANMAVRVSVLQGRAPFDPMFGAGSRFFAAEDSDFIYRVGRSGWRVRFEPDVLVYHEHGRRSDAQVEELNRGYVISRGAFYGKHLLRMDRDVARAMYWEFRSILLSPTSGRRWRPMGRLLRGMIGYMAARVLPVRSRTTGITKGPADVQAK